jgi:formate C-acetyltransferase
VLAEDVEARIMTGRDRIEYLREEMLDVSHAHYRVRRPLSILNGGVETKPVVIRKAMAFDLILREMPIFIENGELIVGSRTMFLPREREMKFWEEGVKRNLDFVPDAETLNGESPGLEFYPHYATEEEKALGRKVSIGEGYVTSHCTAGYGKVLEMGFGGIKEQALSGLKDVEPSSNQAGFLEAVAICMDGATHLVERYEEEAKALASRTREPTRKRELQSIAEICNRIKTQPARTFHEALQLLWFTHMLILIESYNLMALGRLDQYLYPYYERDVAGGGLSREQAFELLACFFIKLNDTSDLHTDNGLNIMLSGLKPDGEDGTNRLTHLCLDTYEAIRLTDPQINIRYHEKTPQDLLDRAVSIWRVGPKPMIYNDHAVIEAMQKVGVAPEDARDYCIDACQDLMIEGKSDFYPIFAGIYGIHLLTIMERVVDRLATFSSFESFWKNLKEEVSADVRKYVEKANQGDRILPKISPTPFLSATLHGCIEAGKDKTGGGTVYNFTGFVGGGLVNVADSAAAIKKLVFEEKRISAARLARAIQRDFEQDEPLRQMLKNKAPKWGSNDDYVDQLARELADHFCTEVLKYDNPRGGRFVPGFFTHHQARLGQAVRATPDGRKRGDPLAVSLSPSLGAEKNGPTGAILSASKINQSKCPLGTSLDLTFYGPSYHGLEERAKMASLIQTYMDMGGIEFQANTLDREVLRDAQRDPEKHRDLVVRVWGFNAYFVTLKREYQEEIIARTEH